MKTCSPRLATLLAVSLAPGLALLIWIEKTIRLDNCCPLVRPVEPGWLSSPFYNLWPTALALGAILATLTLATESRKTHFTRLLLNLILALLISWGLANVVAMAGTFINVKFDSSPPRVHQSQLVEKYTTSSSRAPVMYFLIATDWRSERGARVLLRVNRETFEAVSNTTPLLVTTKSGRLGAEWVVQVEPAGR
jgi:hypothetical protein